jgi:hypothetical protein
MEAARDLDPANKQALSKIAMPLSMSQDRHSRCDRRMSLPKRDVGHFSHEDSPPGEGSKRAALGRDHLKPKYSDFTPVV